MLALSGAQEMKDRTQPDKKEEKTLSVSHQETIHVDISEMMDRPF